MTRPPVTLQDADRILEKTVSFPTQGAVFERLEPITDFRKDDDEARIVYLCRKVQQEGLEPVESGLFILKCKVQAPSQLAGGLTTPIAGPSKYTVSEIEALRLFADKQAPSVPHLIAWKTAVQGSDGLMPDGYIAYTVMTLLSGNHLMDLKFWSMDDAEKEEIRTAFPVVLKSVWQLGIDPYDCALRNVMWDQKRRVLSLVDFEHWRPNEKDPVNMTEREELIKWGLQHSPPHAFHWQAFFAAETQLH